MKVLTKIREYNLKKAGLCGLAVGIINIVVHIFLIIQIIPYCWVHGGRTTSLSAAVELSISSIILTVINIFIALVASQIIPIKFNRFWGITLSSFLIITLPLTFIGVIQQFFGTWFEKLFMSIVVIFGFLADIRIAFEKRW